MSSNGARLVFVCMNHIPPIATLLPVAMPGAVFSRSNSRGGGELMICAWLVIRYATRAASSVTTFATMRSQAGTPLRQ